MRNMRRKALYAALVGGSFLLQLPGCTEQAIYVSALATSASAAGVLYLVRRVID